MVHSIATCIILFVYYNTTRWQRRLTSCSGRSYFWTYIITTNSPARLWLSLSLALSFDFSLINTSNAVGCTTTLRQCTYIEQKASVCETILTKEPTQPVIACWSRGIPHFYYRPTRQSASQPVTTTTTQFGRTATKPARKHSWQTPIFIRATHTSLVHEHFMSWILMKRVCVCVCMCDDDAFTHATYLSCNVRSSPHMMN